MALVQSSHRPGSRGTRQPPPRQPRGWYRESRRRQLDGLTFDIYSVIPESCHLPENEDYYSYTEVWERVVRDVQPCAPAVHFDPGFIWALYVDVEEACDGLQELGRGGGGLTRGVGEGSEGCAPGL